MIARLRGALAVALVLAACAHVTAEAAPRPEAGIASYYGDESLNVRFRILRPSASGKSE